MKKVLAILLLVLLVLTHQTYLQTRTLVSERSLQWLARKAEIVVRHVYVRCTGYFDHDKCIGDMQFVGTVVPCGGQFVWHVFIGPEVQL